MNRKSTTLGVCCAVVLAGASFSATDARAADEAESLEQLRNTVINLLEGLVQKGVLTREQAQAMVADAQTKAAEAAKAKAEQRDAEKDAVRVTYVPEVVRKQIGEEIRAELKAEVAKDVVEQAKKDKWGVPGALPAWVNALKFSGDVRVRGQSDMYADDNANQPCLDRCYPDFQTINARGGAARAGNAEFLNTTEDRLRERLRLRVGLSATLAPGITAGLRLASGNAIDPVSTNQTLGQSGARYQVGIDQAYLRFDLGAHSELPWMTIYAGRFANPWLSTDLVFDPDLQFEGVAATWRYGFDGAGEGARNLFFTAGAFPLQEIELTPKDKWLFGGQLGLDWPWSRAGRFRVGAAYYYYSHVSGVRNAADSSVFDYTAPAWLQKGNTLFDIRNDLDTTTNLFALAADYRLANVTIALELPAFGHKVILTGDAVRNIGFDQARIFQRAQLLVDERTDGYQVDLAFGSIDTGQRANWRAAVGYKYLQRDAVLDAFTDSDFHLGGTDAKGYFLRGEWWFRDRTSLALRYFSADEIDGPLLGIDTLMLDIMGQF